MLSSALLQTAIGETYADVEDTIEIAVRKFVRRYGGDYDEIRAEANWFFLEAYYDYEADRGASFATWVQYRITMRLLDQYRTRLYKLSLAKDDPRRQRESVQRPQSFYLWDFVDGLTEDGAFLVGLLFNMPAEIKLTLLQLEGDNPAYYYAAIKEYLMDLGWDVDRVLDAYVEVRERLEEE